jgi:hypothetical protein
VKAWLFSDHEVVTVPVLSRFSSDAYVTSGKVRWPRLLASARSVASSVGWSGWLLVFVNTLAFARAFRRGDPKMKPRLLRYLAAHGLLWTIALLLAVFARILPRVISPMIALYACASVVTVVELGVPSLPDRMRRSRRILAVFAGVLCAALFAAAVQRMSVCRRGEQSNVDLLRTLRDRLRGSVVVLTRPALPAFAYIDPLEGIDLDHGSRFVIVGGWPCLLRGYDEDARSLAGSSRFPDLWLALARWRALVVSNDHYNRFLRRYLSTLYGVELDFSPRSAWMAVGPGPKHQVRVYGLATSPPGGSRLDSWGRPARGATAGELLGEE